MKKILLSFVIAFSLAIGAGNVLAPTVSASATSEAKKSVCAGVSGQVGAACGTGGTNLTKVVSVVLNIISVIAGIAAVIMIILSGLKYITSAGDAQNVASAKKTLIYAIIGLIVVAFSQFIVLFVLSNLQR